jgi:hypothetical protein
MRWKLPDGPSARQLPEDAPWEPHRRRTSCQVVLLRAGFLRRTFDQSQSTRRRRPRFDQEEGTAFDAHIPSHGSLRGKAL